MNNNLKRYFRSWMPPALLQLKSALTVSEISFNGDWSDWSAAVGGSSGYDSGGILEKVKQATRAVVSGQAAFERDSVLFDEIQYSWPVLAGLLKVAAISEGHLRVLDIGGALGSSYYQNRKFIEQLKELKWCIVEQESFVECGKREFETNVLKFFHSIEEAAKTCNFNVVLLSSVLPYLESPYDMLEKIIKLGARTVIIDRTPVLSGNADRLTVQKVPAVIYSASYPAWFLSENKLLNTLGSEYIKILEFKALHNEIILESPRAVAKDKGFIFERRNDA